MAYAQIHVFSLSSEKVLGLSAQSFRVWIAGLCYCQEHLTDGAIPRVALRALRVPVRATYINELVAAKLWDVTSSGWQVHDYADWNDTRAEVEKKRAKWRRQKRNQGKTSTVESTVESVVDSTPHSAHRIRSTDQDQDQDPAASGGIATCGNVENSVHAIPTPTKPVPTRTVVKGDNPSAVGAVVRNILADLDGRTYDMADVKEETKLKCARLGLHYDAEIVARACDAAEHQIARQQRSAS